uniref:Uncharacterized protein n=1 Tax=Anguilla anguilla TaxID=7936 RepID=A0A0E9XSU4_ANGAN
MLLLQGRLNLLYLLRKEVNFALEEFSGFFHVLFHIIACSYIHQHVLHITESPRNIHRAGEGDQKLFSFIVLVENAQTVLGLHILCLGYFQLTN